MTSRGSDDATSTGTTCRVTTNPKPFPKIWDYGKVYPKSTMEQPRQLICRIGRIWWWDRGCVKHQQGIFRWRRHWHGNWTSHDTTPETGPNTQYDHANMFPKKMRNRNRWIRWSHHCFCQTADGQNARLIPLWHSRNSGSYQMRALFLLSLRHLFSFHQRGDDLNLYFKSIHKL